MELKDRIKAIQVAKTRTIRQFAEELGVPKVTIESNIYGRTKFSAETIVLILKTYPDISAEWLLREKGEMFVHGGQSIVNTNSQTINHGNVVNGDNSGTVGNGNQISNNETINKLIEQNAKLINMLAAQQNK